MTKSSLLILAALLIGGSASLCAQSTDAVYTKVDESPVPVRMISPASIRGESGLVAIMCVVDENGKVVDATVSKSTNAALEQSALTAVQKWGFKPGKKDGKAVKAKIMIPVRFEDQA